MFQSLFISTGIDYSSLPVDGNFPNFFLSKVNENRLFYDFCLINRVRNPDDIWSRSYLDLQHQSWWGFIFMNDSGPKLSSLPSPTSSAAVEVGTYLYRNYWRLILQQKLTIAKDIVLVSIFKFQIVSY